MFCSRYSCTLSKEICIKRQEKAQKQSETSFVESLIFCCKCDQGTKIKDTKKLLDFDIICLKKDMIKCLIAKKDFSLFKIKRIELKRPEKVRKLQLKRRE